MNVHIAAFTFASEIVTGPIEMLDCDKVYLIRTNRGLHPAALNSDAFSDRVKSLAVAMIVVDVAENVSTMYDAIDRIAESELRQGHRVSINASSGTRLFTVAAAMSAARHRDIELYYVEPQTYYVQRDFSRGIERIVHLAVPRPTMKEIPVDSELCFVLMPFAPDLRQIYDDVIAPTVAGLGLRCIRADDLFDNRPIMDDIWDNIRRSRLVIADLTGRNPNVFYEAGIAHALGKEVVLISRSIEDVPFDLRHIRCLIYSDTLRGAKKLVDDLAKTLSAVVARTAVRNPRPMRVTGENRDSSTAESFK